MAYFSDLVRDTTTTTGTGDITLSGVAPTGRVAFGSAFAVGQLVQYSISTSSGAEWEDGIAPLSTSTTIQRSSALTKVIASSNAGALVNFSAGTKDVYNALPSYFANSYRTRGHMSARHLVLQ